MSKTLEYTENNDRHFYSIMFGRQIVSFLLGFGVVVSTSKNNINYRFSLLIMKDRYDGKLTPVRVIYHIVVMDKKRFIYIFDYISAV